MTAENDTLNSAFKDAVLLLALWSSASESTGRIYELYCIIYMPYIVLCLVTV